MTTNAASTSDGPKIYPPSPPPAQVFSIGKGLHPASADWARHIAKVKDQQTSGKPKK